MKWNDLFENWSITYIKLDLKFAQLEFEPNQEDEKAAWEMYVEMVTRITTQTMQPERGDEKTALDSIKNIFGITRGVLKEHGRKCKELTRITIIVLNQVIRTFTTKWHRLSLQNAFDNLENCNKFREELINLEKDLII